MSTRSVIGVLTGGDPEQGTIKFDGRYHHSDGYPEGLGLALLNHLRDHFKGNMQGLVDYFVYSDEAKCGWSNVLGADLSHVPISPEGRMQIVVEKGIEAALNTNDRAPVNYASRGYEPEYMMDAISESWQEWGYIFDIPRNSMYVLKWLYEDQREPLAETGWYLLGRYDLGSKERTPEMDKLIMTAYESMFYNNERGKFHNLPCLKAVDGLKIKLHHAIEWVKEAQKDYNTRLGTADFVTLRTASTLEEAKVNLMDFIQTWGVELATTCPGKLPLDVGVMALRYKNANDAYTALKAKTQEADALNKADRAVANAHRKFRKHLAQNRQPIIDTLIEFD
jgi:hypothetical protein